jgi:hypothetical protein
MARKHGTRQLKRGWRWSGEKPQRWERRQGAAVDVDGVVVRATCVVVNCPMRQLEKGKNRRATGQWIVAVGICAEAQGEKVDGMENCRTSFVGMGGRGL